ncbi:MAG TPA: hypothetical protein VEB19_06740, partial [Gemmatimonadaceae bacterium]|nr:hypothetical protein [Gemmatimonadaceae bacterium]
MRWLICWVSVCVIVVTRDAIAQATGVAMEGVVFDSLRMQPLAGALVGVVGAGSTTTDARGRFRISDIAAGERTVVVAHALLDTIGISTLVRRVRVNGRTRVTVAIPSFSTLWKLACGEAIPHKDHGFIYGSIRDADGEPVVSARIELSWIQTSVDGKKHIRQQQLRSQTVTDSSGSYGVCGVPASTAIRVQASAGGSTSGEIDIFPSDLRAIRQDLVMGPADTAARGVIVGTLTDPAG